MEETVSLADSHDETVSIKSNSGHEEWGYSYGFKWSLIMYLFIRVVGHHVIAADYNELSNQMECRLIHRTLVRHLRVREEV